MKRIIVPVLTGLIFGAIGFLAGKNIGFEDGFQSAEMMQRLRSIDEIKMELKGREQDNITHYLDGKAGVENVDEGSLFKIKYVQYFSGNLTNSATLATAKDIKLNVDFYSKTGSKIGNQEIMLYEFIDPGRTVEFKERIDIPENVDDFKFQIIDARSE